MESSKCVLVLGKTGQGKSSLIKGGMINQKSTVIEKEVFKHEFITVWDTPGLQVKEEQQSEEIIKQLRETDEMRASFICMDEFKQWMDSSKSMTVNVLFLGRIFPEKSSLIITLFGEDMIMKEGSMLNPETTIIKEKIFWCKSTGPLWDAPGLMELQYNKQRYGIRQVAEEKLLEIKERKKQLEKRKREEYRQLEEENKRMKEEYSRQLEEENKRMREELEEENKRMREKYRQLISELEFDKHLLQTKVEKLKEDQLRDAAKIERYKLQFEQQASQLVDQENRLTELTIIMDGTEQTLAPLTNRPSRIQFEHGHPENKGRCYWLFHKYQPSVVEAVKPNVVDIADEFASQGLISITMQKYIANCTMPSDSRAEQLVKAVQVNLDNNPENFRKIVGILRGTKDLKCKGLGDRLAHDFLVSEVLSETHIRNT